MSDPFTKLLTERGVLLADGATGTNLFNMGLMPGDAPELWNTDEPAKIRALYKGAIDAGSDLFLTNSFGANAARLKLHGAQKRAFELSKQPVHRRADYKRCDDKRRCKDERIFGHDLKDRGRRLKGTIIAPAHGHLEHLIARVKQ